MEIRIKEKGYGYVSDFPDGWKFSRGDYFKFPVPIGASNCFIKRFEQNTANITGWNLLNALSEKFEPNLARVFGIGKATENNQTVHYVFFEFIQGKTIHELVAKKIKFDLGRFTDHLFNALQTLQKRGHWFPDFFEKNIFAANDGRFLLIDLDSAQPLIDKPDNEMWGCKDYWALVFNYYSKVLHLGKVQPQHFNGASFNYLHAVFLVLRLKIFYADDEMEYDAVPLFNHLPAYLDAASPECKTIFNNVYKSSATPLSDDEIANIKTFIHQTILSTGAPFIKPQNDNTDSTGTDGSSLKNTVSFTVTNYLAKDGDLFTVASGSTFTLEWVVENSVEITLYKNGSLLQKFDGNQNSIVLNEKVYDGQAKKIEYRLLSGTGIEKTEKTLVVQIVQGSLNPVISSFSLTGFTEKNGTDYTVETGKMFTLHWDVQHAQKMELLRNDQLLAEVNQTSKGYDVKEDSYDGKEKWVEFALVAYKETTAIEMAEKTILRVKAVAAQMKQPEITNPPVISLFKTSHNVLRNGGSYSLKWVVQNATSMGLYRNGMLYKNFENNETSLEENEKYEGAVKHFRYSLYAANSAGQVKSKTADVFIKPAINFLKIALFLLLAGVVGAGVYFLLPVLKHKKPIIFNSPSATAIKAGDTISFTGKNIAANDTGIVVRFNRHRGNIISILKDSITVEVPTLDSGTTEVNIDALKGNKVYPLATHMPYHTKENVSEPVLFPIAKAIFTQGELITITGQNLPVDKTIALFFNQTAAKIISQTSTGIVAQVPDLKEKTVTVFARGSTGDIQLAQSVPYQKSEGLVVETAFFPISQHAVSEGDIINIPGNNLPRDKGNVVVKFNNIQASVIQLTARNIKVQVPSLPKETGFINISIMAGKQVFSVGQHISYQAMQTAIFLNTQSKTTEGQNLYISGKNIPTGNGIVEVFFNNTKARIVDQTSTLVQVQVPSLPPGTTQVDVSVKANGKEYMVSKNMQFQALKTYINLCDAVSFSLNYYRTGVLKLGNKHVDLAIKNNGKYLIDNVLVTVTYTQKNGDIQTEELSFNDIQPGAAINQRSKKDIKDAEVKYQVKTITSKEFGVQKCK